MKLKTFIRGLWERTHGSAKFGACLTAALIATLVVFNTVLYGLSNHFSWYFYTDTKLEHTISGVTDEYLREVSGSEVTILFCDNQEDLESDSVYNLVWQTANQYAERYDFVTVETVNIFVNPEKVAPYKYEKDPETGAYVVDPETGKYVTLNPIDTSSVIFVGGETYAVLTMQSFFVLDSDDLITAYNGEEVVASMIHRVQNGNMPKAYFTANHGETYAMAFYNRLLCAGYVLEPVDLMTQDIEVGEGNLLIISNPQYDFVRGNQASGIVGELDKIDAFLSEGGSVWTMLDPLVTNTVQLEGFLTSWGITVERAYVEDEVTGNTVTEAVMVRDSIDSVTTDGYSLITTPSGSDLATDFLEKMDEVEAGRVIISRVSPLALTDVTGKTVSSLLSSSSSSRAYAAGDVYDDRGNFSVAAHSRDNQSGGQVFAVGSVYFTAQNAITTNEYGNKDMIFLLLKELSHISVPMGCTYLIFTPTTLEDLTMAEARLWTALLAGVIPVGIGICGVAILGKRRYR